MGVSAAATWHGVCRVRPWHSHEENTAFFQHQVYYIKPIVWEGHRGMALNTFLIQHLRNVAQTAIGCLIKPEYLVRQWENYRDPIAG